MLKVGDLRCWDIPVDAAKGNIVPFIIMLNAHLSTLTSSWGTLTPPPSASSGTKCRHGRLSSRKCNCSRPRPPFRSRQQCPRTSLLGLYIVLQGRMDFMAFPWYKKGLWSLAKHVCTYYYNIWARLAYFRGVSQLVSDFAVGCYGFKVVLVDTYCSSS